MTTSEIWKMCMDCTGGCAEDVLFCKNKSCESFDCRITSELMEMVHEEQDIKTPRTDGKQTSTRPVAKVTARRTNRKKVSISSADVVTSMLIYAAYSAAYATLRRKAANVTDVHKQAATAKNTRYGCVCIPNTGR